MRTFLTTSAVVALLAAPVAATPALDFIIDGDTFTSPFSFTNTSDGGEQLLSFSIDLSATTAVFDPVTGGVPNTTLGVPFTPVGGSDVTTGLTSSSVVDGGTTLDITFSDFDAGESFTFDLDVDQLAGSPTVFGNDLIGATAIASFDDGQSVIGIFAALAGNPDASGFMATGIIPTPPAVPLPAAMPLLLAGLGGMALVSRRRRKSA